MTKPILAAVAFTCLVAGSSHPVLADDAVPPAIEAACIAKLAEIANRAAAEIKATGIAPEGAGQVVTLDLDGAENPWLCHVDAAGGVIDVMYQGEG